MADNFDKWDQQELQKDRTDAKKEKDDQKQFKAALKNRRNEFRKRVKEEEGTGTKSRQRERFKAPLTKAEAKDRKRYQTNVLPGDLEEEVVQSWAPPGAKVHQDTWNGRWSVAMDGYLRSRSWLKYEHSESAFVVLAKMWERFMELFGLDECPVPGLMEKAKDIETKLKEAADKAAVELATDKAAAEVDPPGGYMASSSEGPMVPLDTTTRFQC